MSLIFANESEAQEFESIYRTHQRYNVVLGNVGEFLNNSKELFNLSVSCLKEDDDVKSTVENMKLAVDAQMMAVKKAEKLVVGYLIHFATDTQIRTIQIAEPAHTINEKEQMVEFANIMAKNAKRLSELADSLRDEESQVESYLLLEAWAIEVQKTMVETRKMIRTVSKMSNRTVSKKPEKTSRDFSQQASVQKPENSSKDFSQQTEMPEDSPTNTAGETPRKKPKTAGNASSQSAIEHVRESNRSSKLSQQYSTKQTSVTGRYGNEIPAKPSWLTLPNKQTSQPAVNAMEKHLIDLQKRANKKHASQ